MLRSTTASLLMLVTSTTLAAPPPARVRFATYNVSFFRSAAGALVTEMNTPAGTTANHGNIRQVAEALQRQNPDVLLLNEFDYDAGWQAMHLFHDNYLAVPQQPGLTGLNYPYRYTAPSNTGISTGFDLDNNGAAVTTPGTDLYGNDCFGFGQYPGQYGLVIYFCFGEFISICLLAAKTLPWLNTRLVAVPEARWSRGKGQTSLLKMTLRPAFWRCRAAWRRSVPA